jgi:hypothetical protein
MAKYVFTPYESSTLGTNQLIFGGLNDLSLTDPLTYDYNNSPADGGEPEPVLVDIRSSIKKGDFVYALTKQAAVFTQNYPDEPTIGTVLTDEDNIALRDSDGNIITYDGTNLGTVRQKGYAISDSEMCKVVDVSYDGNLATVTLDKILKTDVYGVRDNADKPDSILFENDIKTINEAKIGFDRDAPQLVNTDIALKDVQSSKNLQDEGENLLTTTEQTFYASALKTGNATSVTVSNTTSQTESGGPVGIAEQFPQESEVSSSLLGVPRAEEQLSLFSDVSTLGMDEDNWEVTVFQRSKLRNEAWENRASELGGTRYVGKMQENTIEQALELTSNLAPFSYPWPAINLARWRGGDGSNNNEWDRFKRWIILGNLLYIQYEGTPIADRFLDPAKVSLRVIKLRRATGLIDDVEILSYGNGISEDNGFRLIDVWTVTWMRIRRDTFDGTSKSIIDTFSLARNSQPIQDLLSHMETQLQTTLPSVLEDDERRLSLKIYTDQLQAFLIPDFTFTNTQPGYIETNDPQEVRLQTKEVYRYQPGRISGFTFGTKCAIDPRMVENVAEWGVVNETDQYIFQLAGPTLSIVRRSTVPLSDESVLKSQKGQYQQQYINGTDYLERGNEPVIDQISGLQKDPYYELKIPQAGWNVDGLDGNGPSGYTVDVRNVTMWKIEFSWYGAIGARFYAYIPVGSGEARWVVVHRIVIENLLTRANLEDPYFRMRYTLLINNRTESLDPQFIYKYGSSVYIDGGDEGTKKQFSFSSKQREVPEDVDTDPNADPDLNRFEPLLAIRSKDFIQNSDGVNIKNRIIAYPEEMCIDATELVHLEFRECTAAKGYGYTYDDGIIWARDASPGYVPETRAGGGVISGQHANVAMRSLSGRFKDLGHKTRDDSPNAGRTIDVIYEFEPQGGAEIAYRMRLVKPTEFVTKHNKRVPSKFGFVVGSDDGPDSPFITKDDHLAKLINPGMNGFYIDYDATVADAEIKNASTGLVKGTKAAGNACFTRFRVRRLQDNNRPGYGFQLDSRSSDVDAALDNTTTQYMKLPIDKDYPIMLSSMAFAKADFATAPYHNVPNSPYYTMNSPWGSAYGVGKDGDMLFRKDFFTRHYAEFAAAVSAQGTVLPGEKEIINIAEEFKTITRTISGVTQTFRGRNPDFPFITVRNGDLSTKHLVDKSVCRAHDADGTGLIVPHSSLFGRIKISRANEAVVSSEDVLSGKKITMRFLNPHAGYNAFGQNRNIHTGNPTRYAWPEFSVGFTTLKPSSTFVKDNTFLNAAGDKVELDEGNHISVDYTHREVNYDTTYGAETYYGEINWQNAGRLRQDYRIKSIPNENYKAPGFSIDGQVQGSVKTEPGFSYTANSPTAIYHNIGGYGSTVQLEVDSLVTYDAPKKFANFAAFISDIKGNITTGTWIEFPDFPDGEFTVSKFDDAADLPTIGMSLGDTGFIVIDDDTFNSIFQKENISLIGGALVDGASGQGAGDIIFTSEPVRFRYWVATGSAPLNTAQGVKNSGAGTNASGYLIRVSSNPTAAGILDGGGNLGTSIQATFVKLSFPEGINGVALESKRKLMGKNPRNFYPYIRLKKGAQLNAINYLLENENSKSIISPEWKFFGAAILNRPLASDDVRITKSLTSAGAGKFSGEVFNSIGRLSGLEVSNEIRKPLRSAVSEPQFVSLSTDINLLGNFPGGIKLYDDRNKLVERAKSISSYYIGTNTGDNNKKPTISKARTSSISLRSIFGEDRTKIMPDDFGTRAFMVAAQKVNIEDTDTTAKVRATINVSEI